MKTRAHLPTTATLVCVGCGLMACAGPPPTTTPATTPTTTESSPADLSDLQAALPAGWEYEVRPGPGGRASTIRFARPSLECAIHYGADGAEVRTEPPRVEVTLYPLEDEAALHAQEAPFALLSSHCPQDLLLARSSEHFVAVSPCDRAYGTDERCASAAAELETALRTYFAGR